MLPPHRDLHIPIPNIKNVKTSGVLMLIFPDGNDIYSCLIKRSATMKIHASQIGFPGGRQDKEDNTPCDTAIRETYEEIGLPSDRLSILGNLSPLYVSVSNFMIYPYVAWTHEKPQFILNSREVEKIFNFPILQHLKEPGIKNSEMETVSGKLVVPGIPFSGEFIWGATAMILIEFLDILSAANSTQE
jgi:8-oxo-dGTP pyrophosphatase MutT (NUDIX family)